MEPGLRYDYDQVFYCFLRSNDMIKLNSSVLLLSDLAFVRKMPGSAGLWGDLFSYLGDQKV